MALIEHTHFEPGAAMPRDDATVPGGQQVGTAARTRQDRPQFRDRHRP